MSIAEQKIELLKLVVEADEETTRKLIEFAHQLAQKTYKFSDEEIKIFEEGRDEFFASGKKGYTIEEAHEMIRRRNKE